MRIGVLGGTFDPIHLGHLVVAEEARVRMALEKVLFVPTGQPYLREEPPAAPGTARLEMVRRAISGNPFFRACALEVERSGPTYTLETLRVLQETLGPEAELSFILGMDSLQDLPRWREPREILAVCTLVVYPRWGASSPDLDGLDRRVPGLKERAVLLATPAIGISGRELRRRVAQGLSIRYWVPEVVERFIAEHGLYRPEGAHE